jgi:predicted peptidase
MVKFQFMFLLLVVCFVKANAQLQAITKGTNYNFWLRLPEDYQENGDKQPILVFLHGRSLSGTDLNRVKRYGVLYAMDKGKEIPGIIVAPQTNRGWDPDHVIEIIDYVLEKYNADPSRVYVCGMSMGGYGTMDVAGKYPDRIAAAVAICGGGTLSYAENLTRVPLWIQHGSADRAVPASESKKIYNAIKKADQKSDATLTIIPGGTHGSVERLFHQEKIYEWMFSYAKEEEIKRDFSKKKASWTPPAFKNEFIN